MQKHVAQLYETFGRSAGEDLKTLGFQNAAEQLQQAVAACKRKQIPETLASHSRDMIPTLAAASCCFRTLLTPARNAVTL